MAISEEEFNTNKSIAVPPKPIPFFDNEDLLFVQFWYSFSIAIFVFSGIFGNLLRSIKVIDSLPSTFYNALALGLFIFFPIAIVTLMKILKSGKTQGYIEQKLFFYFNSKLLSSLNNSNSTERKELYKANKGVYRITDTKEYWEKTKINGKSLNKFIDIEENRNIIENDYNESVNKLNSQINSRIKNQERKDEEINFILNNYYKFMEEQK